MSGELIRILSDIHYAERASRVRSLDQLCPLLDGVTGLVVNGDMMDTRPGPDPALTARARAEVRAFFRDTGRPVTFLTGNHDPDISAQHWADLADGRVFVTHGDILFPDIVPWGQDIELIAAKLSQARAGLPAWDDLPLAERMRVIREVAAAVPQRHQSEQDPLKYALRFAKDTIWPPTRILKVLRAWRELPARAAALLRRDRPKAKFAVVGHTHHPGIWPAAPGIVVINTGAFCRLFHSFVVDLSPGRLTVRRVEARRGAYYPSGKVADFALSP